MNHLLQNTMPQLTHREHEILAHIANGLSNKEIADKLRISNNTVANHRKNMRMKMGVKSTIELLLINKNGDIQPNAIYFPKAKKAFQKSLL
jgi:DNA-binding CsgD family transcriptional regulator